MKRLPNLSKDKPAIGILVLVSAFIILFVHSAFSSTKPETLKKSPSYKLISVKIVKTISLPKGYHEGLFLDGMNMLVCNGMKGKIWVVDIGTGEMLSEITPVSDFAEGITKRSDGFFFLTEWNAKGVYRAKIKDGRMVVEASVSLDSAHPAGVAWGSDKLFVITWTRGMGTKFDLLEMDGALTQLAKVSIKNIEEPDQLAWDGKNLWITSWYDPLVYKVDVETMEIVGAFRSPVSKTTGIASDGEYLWLTGTYSDLYKLEIVKQEGGDPMKITVTSSEFKEGEMIPSKYTCDGKDMSPPLAWSGIPPAAKSIAMISDDPDAPMGTWVHWVIYNMPADLKGLPENMPQAPILENGAVQGINDSHSIGYGGPCPPSGVHRYYFKVYALDTKLSLKGQATKKDLEKAMAGHILDEGQLMGRYKR